VGLLNYIIRRLLLMVLVLIGVSLLVFGIMMLIPPGQRVGIYVHGEKVTPAQMESLIEKYGLRDPFPVQYARWMRNIFRGDFGFSVTASAPVLEGFKRYFPTTFELVLYATPLIILVGVWLGTAGAVHKDKPIDHGTRVFAIFGYSLPTFWLGLLLLMVLYGYFGIFPPGVVSNEGKDLLFSPEFNRYTGLITIDAILNWEWGLFWDGLYHLILPAVNLVILNSALILRLMRSSMLEALGQDYIRTAIAKGASTRAVINLHARRNAMIPVITISGYMFAILMAGMVITETIFVREGIGRWMARAALQLDVPAIMFNVLFLGTIFVTVNLIVDIIYAYVDPRIRLT
jgi:ABC-type dipeptide/oligopeptide/nickel transport system permease component